jgi:hypothetical protein
VTLRNGSQYPGTFLSATSRDVTIVDNSGARRTFNVRDVQQLTFGDQNSTSNYNSSGNYNANSTGSYNSTDSVTLVSRLRQDISNAMNNANLTEGQRQSLQDATETLRQAAESTANGFDPNAREVRLALNNIVSLFDSNAFSSSDRQTVLEDVRQLRQARTDYRNNRGTRNRTQDQYRYRNQ